MTIRNEHKVNRTLLMLRETFGLLNIKEIKLEAILEAHVSKNTMICPKM